MRRRLFTFFAAVSLLLFAASCVLWVRSYWVHESLHHYDETKGREYGLYSTRGQVAAYRVSFAPGKFGTHEVRSSWSAFPTMTNLDARVALIKSNAATEGFGPWAGFAFFRKWPSSHGSYYFEVMFPHWAVVAVTGVLPAWAVRRSRRRRQRHAAGLCPTCGYDLRATPDRCPECGRGAA